MKTIDLSEPSKEVFKKNLTFKSDYLFKYCLVGSDAKTKKIRHSLISMITGLKVIDSTVLNPELVPDHDSTKGMFLDVLVRTQDNAIVNIEMQNSTLDNRASSKSLAYLSRLYASQIIGEEPEDFFYTHQILFVNGKADKMAKMVSHMKFQDEDGNKMSDKVEAHIVFLPYINEIMKTKTIDELTCEEAIYYLFENGISDGTIELGRKYEEVAIFMEKKTAFALDDEEVVKAMIRQHHLEMEWARLQDAKEAGEEKSIKLMSLLIADGRMDDLQKMAADKVLRQKLYEEYEIE